MKRIILHIFISVFILGIIFPLNESLYAQKIPKADSLALQDIISHISEKIKFKVKNPIKKYRFRRLSTKNIEQIIDEFLDQFYQQGYHLVKMDSIYVVKRGKENQGILHFIITPGPIFILKNISWELSDSLRIFYDELIHEKVHYHLSKPYNESRQKIIFRDVVKILENSGYPLCKIRIKDFSLSSEKEKEQDVALLLEIIPGPLVKISGLRLPAKSNIDTRYLERTFRFHPDEVYQEKRIERYERVLKRQDFVESTQLPQLIMDEDSLFLLDLLFKKSASTSFDGIVGYVPPPANIPNEKGYFTGLFNIGLKNLFGTGRRLDVYWQKPDRYSEEFRVKYREPFILGLPFHIGGEIHRLIRDTTYIEWNYSFNSEIPLSENIIGTVRFYKREVIPDSFASRTLRIPRTEAIHTELGIRWDTKNDFYNPTKGFLFDMVFDYGTQQNKGPQYLIEEDSLIKKVDVTKFKGRFAVYLKPFKRLVLSFDFNTVLVSHQGQPVLPPDMFWFGGATTIRGYRENQFFGERVYWLNAEYRFLLGPRSRLFFFIDNAYYRRKVPDNQKEFLRGYGLGIRFPGPLGVLQVDYGLAEGLSFSEGKIHFRLINEF